MASTVDEAFRQLLGWLTPTAAERSAAASHRASIEGKLSDKFGVYRMFESGSFKHGTGVHAYSDVDYFVSLKSGRPQLSSSTLNAVRTALIERFPATNIRVARPAVVLDFAGGDERVEVIPAYAQETVNGSDMRFVIPGVTTDWMYSTPEAHLTYVNDCNQVSDVSGGAKALARILKGWKYNRSVPVSSFYLEMRAAKYATEQSYINYALDTYYLTKSLLAHELASMQDPTGSTGYIKACSSQSSRNDAISKLRSAVSRAERAVQDNSAGRIASAFSNWSLFFNGYFPAYS